jgi:hypothetical protein
MGTVCRKVAPLRPLLIPPKLLVSHKNAIDLRVGFPNSAIIRASVAQRQLSPWL